MNVAGPSHQQIRSRSQVAVAASGCCDMIYASGYPRDINMTSILRGTLAALAFTSTDWLAATPAAANDGETCAKASGDEAIAACTRAINSGRYSGHQLAALFNNRCSEWNGKHESDKAIEDCNQAIPNTIAPSRITTKRSGLIRTAQIRSTIAATPITPKANPTAPSRISTKRSSLIRTTQRSSTTAASPIKTKANTTAPSRIMIKRSGLIRTTQMRSTTAAYHGNGRTICNARWRILRSAPNWPRPIRTVQRQLNASQRL